MTNDLSGLIKTPLPDFMGVWFNDEGARSPFFLFIDSPDKLDFHGSVQDLLGRASFMGSIEAEKVEFKKEYVNQEAGMQLRGDVIYQGAWNGEEYEGTYSGNGGTGKFFLQPYCSSKILDIFMDNVVRKNKR